MPTPMQQPQHAPANPDFWAQTTDQRINALRTQDNFQNYLVSSGQVAAPHPAMAGYMQQLSYGRGPNGRPLDVESWVIDYQLGNVGNPLEQAPLGYGQTAWLADWAAEQGWSADVMPPGLTGWEAELWLNLFDPWRQNTTVSQGPPTGPGYPVSGQAVYPGTHTIQPQGQVPLPVAATPQASTVDISPWLQGLLAGGGMPQTPWGNPFTF